MKRKYPLRSQTYEWQKARREYVMRLARIENLRAELLEHIAKADKALEYEAKRKSRIGDKEANEANLLLQDGSKHVTIKPLRPVAAVFGRNGYQDAK